MLGLMLGQRLRRWPNIKPTLGERLMFPGVSRYHYLVMSRRSLSSGRKSSSCISTRNMMGTMR